ncbi:class I SAM-dependent methyltransferase [Novipirellula sp.]|uniref:class I SAM-dependent methyltransferase n=1 Tax=Novipirellula sp. TaxID=2795430 RepID=UPI00356984DF
MNKYSAYLNPRLTSQNIDLYVIRKAILTTVEDASCQFRGRFLDVGAGNQPYRELIESNSQVSEYVPLDLHDNGAYEDAKYTWDGVEMPFDNDEFDSAMATEVLEHCPNPDITLGEIHRVLKPGAYFLFTVPFVWPLHDCPHDEYRYTPWSLERHLASAGFDEISLWPTGGWDATLAQVLGLWVRRRPMSKTKRNISSWIFRPLIKRLIKGDRPEKSFKNTQYLMPGIAGSARTTRK